MPELRISGEGDRGVIHLPGGDLPVTLRWRADQTPEFAIDKDAPPELVAEFKAAFGLAAEGGER